MCIRDRTSSPNGDPQAPCKIGGVPGRPRFRPDRGLGSTPFPRNRLCTLLQQMAQFGLFLGLPGLGQSGHRPLSDTPGGASHPRQGAENKLSHPCGLVLLPLSKGWPTPRKLLQPSPPTPPGISILPTTPLSPP
eukprot:3953347-Alexandrium_andersonii.AAC.1